MATCHVDDIWVRNAGGGYPVLVFSYSAYCLSFKGYTDFAGDMDSLDKLQFSSFDNIPFDSRRE
ncbi:hypothetical protein GQ600_10455 [Phytophthora cactorum]|nr:hypothetical protein GQ600_10455 [Phytophthora cactorum]